MKWNLFGPLVAGMALAFSSCAHTESSAKNDTLSVEEKFQRYDIDGDGKVSMAEYNEVVTRIIVAAFDVDENGSVSLAEWQSLEGKNSDALFAKIDLNKDGKITMAEALAYTKKNKPFAKKFMAIDSNRDGFVDLSEAKAFAAKMQSAMR